MKVTVLSPVTAEVTIAQASAWLERNGWRRDERKIHSEHFDAWSNGEHLLGVAKQYTETWGDVGDTIGQYTITRLAGFTGRPEADILREMSEVVL